ASPSGLPGPSSRIPMRWVAPWPSPPNVSAPGGCVLAFADSDDDCAVEFARSVFVAAGRPDVRLSVVAAVREFESLFLAASSSLTAAGYFSAAFGGDAEQVRDAAGAVGRLMVSGQYQKTADAIRLLSALSMEEARKCRWYRKLESDLARSLDV